MTTVNIILSVPSETGPVPAVGKVEFHPTARYEYAGDVVLPAPFTVELDVNGEAVVELDPTGIYFAWRVREFMHGGANYYVSVPESATPVNLEDLTRIDPDTLEPIEQFAAWSDLDARLTEVEDGSLNITPETIFTVQGGTNGTQPTFTGAPLFTGSYVKTGDVVYYQVQVEFDNILTFGTGQYYIKLPMVAKYGTMMRDGCLHRASNGKQYAINGHVAAGSDILNLYYTSTTGLDEDFDYNSPYTLTTSDNFHVSGSYIAN